MRIAVGHSEDPLASAAAAETIRQVRAEAGGERVVALLMYVSPSLDLPRALAAIREAWPDVPLLGCTTDGECSSVLRFAEDSLVLTALISDRVVARTGVGRGLSRDPSTGAREAWEQLARHGTPSLCVVVAESMGVDGVALVDAIGEVVPPTVPVVGGTAGDQWQFESTRQIHGSDVLQDSVVMLGLYGPLAVGVGVASGWEPLGPAARVTRANGSAVLEIDHQRALDWFRDALGAKRQPSPEHPFAVYDPPGSDRFYLRAPMKFDENEGSIVFAAAVPVGSEVRITSASREAVLDGAVAAVNRAVERLQGHPSALLVFSCAARKQVLGTRTCEEIEKLRSATGELIPVAGFYTYGEIAALAPRSPARYHNETVVAVLLGT